MKIINIVALILIAINTLEAQDSRLSKVKSYIETMELKGFSGSILIGNAQEIIHKSGYGMADKSEMISNSSETVFDIGSITKQFTAAAILKLEMDGKLSTEDKISHFFEDLPKDKVEISIHQLLTHSAGFPPAIGNDYEEITTNEFLKKAFKQKLSFTPGTAYDYSNVGYTLLGIIIEQVSGLKYEDYLKKNLWKPSGMAKTGYARPYFNKSEVALGYRKNGTEWGRPNEKRWSLDGPFWHLKANGGVLSTVEDMYKWHLAISEDGLLSKAAREKYFTPYVKEGRGANSYYAYGWAIYTTQRGTKLAAHNGGNGIFFADFWRYIDDDLVIIVMSNQASRKVERMAQKIGAIYFGNENPSYEEDKGLLDSDDERLNNLVELILDVFKSEKSEVWKDFIESKCTKEFINIVAMETHLDYFQSFHKDFKTAKFIDFTFEEDTLFVNLENDEGIHTITINLKVEEDSLRIEGLLVD